LIRFCIMMGFWIVMLPITALFCFPWTFISGDIRLLYRVGMWAAITGVRLTGVRIRTVGLDKLDPNRTYIFMSNHVSNLDPPIMLPLIPRRTSVMARHGLFKYPVLGRAMRMGDLVPVDRSDRKAGISAVRTAAEVIRKGVNMTIYIEGGRSFDGRLLPFKKGPFYLAQECQVPVVPVTITGTHDAMPKKRLAIKPAQVEVIFHEVIEPKDFGSREHLMAKVREEINQGLPEEFRENTGIPEQPASSHSNMRA
jgi:1-acyl-sn-glycerol-3-phosphate acyltransferase